MSSAKGRRDEVAAVSADELRQQLVLKKMVGKGGFAAVYLGTYKGQEVAVKVILPEHVFADSLQVKLLLREGQYMSRCTHKNVVKCHCVCQLPADFPGIEGLGHRSSTWALVLEYIGGGSIAALLMRQMSQTRRAYNDYEAYCWMRDVAEALSYLHNAPRPVMHRDVKADNVLLTTDPATGRPTAKLMDFGLMAALDGKNPMLRRRSISLNPGEQLGRNSLRMAAAAGGGGGLGRGSVGPSLAAPSVATYYNDSTHEAGKIFYLLDELPAVTVASVPLPGSRRPSLDGPPPPPAAASAAAGAGGGGGAAPSGVGSRNASFSATPVAAAGGGKPAPARSPLGTSVSSAAATTPPGSLVPLNEDASYHGNTAGYVAMLQAQQEARRAAKEARAAAAAAAPPPPPQSATGSSGHGGGGVAGGSSGRMGPGSLGNSAHGSSAAGGGPAGMSPYDSPAGSGRWGADEVAAGSVKLRMLPEEPQRKSPASALPQQHPYHLQPINHPAAASGGGDAAIAAAAAAAQLLGVPGSSAVSVPVPGRDGSLVRMSRPTTPLGASAKGEAESPPAEDSSLLLREPAAQQPQRAQPPATPEGRSGVSAPIIAIARPDSAAAAAADVATSASPLGLAHANLTGSRPPSRRVSQDAVPIVDVVGGGGAAAVAVGAGGSALGRRSRLAGGAATSVAAMASSRPPSAPSSGVQATLALGRTSAATPGTAAAAAAGSGAALAVMRSGDSVRSVNGQANGKGLGAMSISHILQGRYEQDFQWVWRLTGQTGSCMYMAPEVYRNMPYNEKVDVFSFGVLLYEVFSRTLLLISQLNLKELRLAGLDNPDGYASTVADGYRPPRPKAMPEQLYELISACWAQDPVSRPAMREVVESLEALQEAFAPEPAGGGVGGAAGGAPSCSCVIS